MAITTTTGSEMALAVNKANGKLVLTWTAGDVAFDDKMVETVMSLLFEDEPPTTKGRRRGPGPLTVPVDLADSPSLMKARAEERLQFAVDDGRLKSFAVECKRKNRGALVLSVGYVTRAGVANNLTVPIGS